MNRLNLTGLQLALLLSLLLNLGFLGAVAWHALRAAPQFDLPSALGLDASQRARWETLEAGFLAQYDEANREIRARRDRLVNAVFSDHPDVGQIESERAAIASLQQRQQQRIIAQFLQERDILSESQRRILVDILLQEAPAVPLERQLHAR